MRPPDESFRDVLSTADSRGRRRWVYAAVAAGRFRSRRRAVAWVLIAIYLLAPWVAVGGEQAVRLDLAAARFVVLGRIFFLSDGLVALIALGSALLALFFFSVLCGRIWCGWACPETVFLEFVFRPIETWLEGGPAQRKRLDESPLSPRKALIKTTKWSIFVAIAWLLSNTALAYFVGREELLTMMTHSPLDNLGLFLSSLALMGALLFQFGWFREQFCSVLCPYARFQSVLLDSRSLTIGYDQRRGEPRKELRAQDPKGDCIDCRLCVRVCPAGIDIRNGLQLECVQCAACIDACDSVMVKIGRKKGLIRYDSEDGLAGASETRILRPRLVTYGCLLAVVVGSGILAAAGAETASLQILRGRGELPFSVVSPDRFANRFLLKIANRSHFPESFTIEVEARPGVETTIPMNPFTVSGGEIGAIPLFLTFDSRSLDTSLEISVRLGERIIGHQAVRLIGPESKHE